MKLAIILGTRPEIIKLAPIIRECQKLSTDYYIIHSGQHYSYNMDKVFFEQLRLPDAKYKLEVGSGSHAVQTGKIMSGVEKILLDDRPDFAIVQGDTNTVLGSALAAAKIHVRVGHVEAGLRSYDKDMPEEINRTLADHCSDYLFAPTQDNANTLRAEAIDAERIFVTGNTIVDALYQNIEFAREESSIMQKLNLNPSDFFLATIHRQENVDKATRFANIVNALDKLAQDYKIPVIYPIHPRSKKMMYEFNIIPKKITMIEPQDYFAFLNLARNAKLILTDSGGVQEEACILNVPCVTLRTSTERDETVKVGANIIAGTKTNQILESVTIMLTRKRNWKNPFGDGKASNKILKILRKFA